MVSVISTIVLLPLVLIALVLLVVMLIYFVGFFVVGALLFPGTKKEAGFVFGLFIAYFHALFWPLVWDVFKRETK